MRTETRTTMIPDSRKVYIADDGTEFTSYSKCMDYERDIYRKQIDECEDVIECKELLGFHPFDDGEYPPENTYRWFKPLNENGVELLNKAFPSPWEVEELSHCDIGKWHCVGYYPDEYECYWNALSESQAYANKVLSLLNAIDKEETIND